MFVRILFGKKWHRTIKNLQMQHDLPTSVKRKAISAFYQAFFISGSFTKIKPREIFWIFSIKTGHLNQNQLALASVMKVQEYLNSLSR